jgi:GAF domain-containing protein
MLAWIRQFLAPPIFEDEEKTRVAWLLNIVLLALVASSLLIVLAAVGVHAFRPDSETAFTLLSGIIMTVIFAALWFLEQRGYLRLVSSVLVSIIWALITIWIYTVSGLTGDGSSLVYALIVVLSGLLLGGRVVMVVTAASVLAVLGAFYIEASGLLVVVKRPPSPADPIFVIIPVVLIGVLLRYAINGLSEAIERSRRNERAQIEANRELEMFRASLEHRVAERTSELERRSVQLQAAAEVGQAVVSILDIEELIWRVVELIQGRFELYHAGLLLLDDTGEWAVYRAGSGEAGRGLQEQGFRLRVGGNSMVGWCTANSQVRVAQDVDADEIHFAHTLVPQTRSEAALPLIARGQVLGALSVQSSQVGTFDPSTVAALQTMADQVAVALDNARLFAEGQEALEATRRAYGQLSRQAWTELLRGRTDWGYRFDHQGLTAVEGDWQPEMIDAVRAGQVVVRSAAPASSDDLEHVAGDGPEFLKGEDSRAGSRGHDVRGPALALPLRVREDVIGVLSFHKDSGDEAWTSSETELLHRLTDQLGTALESAQLFQQTRRRAAREQAIRQVTGQMRRAVDVEAILKSTVAELAEVLGVPRAYIRLGTEVELLASRGLEPDDGHPLGASPAEGSTPEPLDRMHGLSVKEGVEDA